MGVFKLFMSRIDFNYRLLSLIGEKYFDIGDIFKKQMSPIELWGNSSDIRVECTLF